MVYGLIVGELDPKDLGEVLKLLNLRYANTYEFAPYTQESFRKFVLENDAKVVVAREGLGIKGAAIFFAGAWGNRIDMLATVKGRNARKIADLLVQEIESRFSGEKLYTTLEAGSPALKYWKRQGYSTDTVWCHMVAALKGMESIPPLRCGATLRSLGPGEEAELIDMTNRVFGFKRLSKGCIQRWKDRHPSFSEEWVQVAEVGGRIVSVVVATPDDEFNEDFGARRGHLGPAATLPEYRGMGLVTALTRRVMNLLFQKGMDSVNLYTSETNTPSIKLLLRLGFQVKSRRVRLAKQL
jgi:ribosomal protein S18 acetylase RimI-like enzyme